MCPKLKNKIKVVWLSPEKVRSDLRGSLRPKSRSRLNFKTFLLTSDVKELPRLKCNSCMKEKAVLHFTAAGRNHKKNASRIKHIKRDHKTRFPHQGRRGGAPPPDGGGEFEGTCSVRRPNWVTSKEKLAKRLPYSHPTPTPKNEKFGKTTICSNCSCLLV